MACSRNPKLETRLEFFTSVDEKQRVWYRLFQSTSLVNHQARQPASQADAAVGGDDDLGRIQHRSPRCHLSVRRRRLPVCWRAVAANAMI